MSRGALATLSINIETRLAELQAGCDKAARLVEKNAHDNLQAINRDCHRPKTQREAGAAGAEQCP